jgi:hypothetical protein
MISQKADTRNSESRMAGDLGRCYGRIGIPAVVAALPYKSSERKTNSDGKTDGDKRLAVSLSNRQN